MYETTLCPKCKLNQMPYDESMCYECYEFEHYNIYSAHVNDIPDHILKEQNKCPIAYSDPNDIRQWHIENGMAITIYKIKKDTH